MASGAEESATSWVMRNILRPIGLRHKNISMTRKATCSTATNAESARVTVFMHGRFSHALRGEFTSESLLELVFIFSVRGAHSMHLRATFAVGSFAAVLAL